MTPRRLSRLLRLLDGIFLSGDLANFRSLHGRQAIAAASLSTRNAGIPRDLDNTAWSFAQFGFTDAPLLEAIAAQSIRLLREWGSQLISNIPWSFWRLHM